MGDGDEKLARLEFEHFIAEFEAFRDTVWDELTDLREKVELLKEALDSLKKQYLVKST